MSRSGGGGGFCRSGVVVGSGVCARCEVVAEADGVVFEAFVFDGEVGVWYVGGVEGGGSVDEALWEDPV